MFRYFISTVFTIIIESILYMRKLVTKGNCFKLIVLDIYILTRDPKTQNCGPNASLKVKLKVMPKNLFEVDWQEKSGNITRYSSTRLENALLTYDN